MKKIFDNIVKPFIENNYKTIIKTAIITFIFIVLSLPYSYNIFFKLFRWNVIDVYNCPTPFGHLFHTFIFSLLYFLFIFIYLYVFNRNYDNYTNIIYDCIISTFVFYFLTNVETLKIIYNIFGKFLANEYGCPTIFGILLLSIIYFIYKYIFFTLTY